MEDQRRRWGNTCPPAAAPARVGKREGRGEAARVLLDRGPEEAAGKQQHAGGCSSRGWGTGEGSAAAASTGGAGEHVREGEQVGLPASAPLSSLISPALLSPRAPNLPHARCFPARLLFPRPFSRARVFLPWPSPYGARLARFVTNRTPNRRLPDAMAVRRTPYQSEASRLANRPACSALPIRRHQSDALKTLMISLQVASKCT
jgi:hypothetical protein